MANDLILLPKEAPLEAVPAGIYIPEDAGIQIVGASSPFSQATIEMTVSSGTTILEMVLKIQPDDFYHANTYAFINGYLIERKHWGSVRPKTGTFINIKCFPMGGGGGGGKKNPLRTILMIVVLVAAVVFAPYLGGILAKSFGAVGAKSLVGLGTLTYGGLAGGIISAVGSLIVNAIAPPPRPKLPTLSGLASNGTGDSAALSITGSRNRINQFGVVPTVLGTHRIVPPFGAVPYTELVGNDQYLRLILTFGTGPLVITELKIGETLLSEFTDVEKEFTRGFQTSQINDLGNWDASTLAFPVSPSFGDKYTNTVIGTINSLEYKVGDTITYSGVSDEFANSGWDVNSGEDFTLYPNAVNELPLSISMLFADGYSVRTTPVNITEFTVEIVFPGGIYTVSGQGNRGEATAQWQVQSKLVSEPTVWTDHGVFEKAINFNKSLRVATRIKFDVAGQYDIRVKRANQEGDQQAPGTIDSMVWALLRTFEPTDPILLSGLCSMALRIKATDQLNNVVDELNAVAQTIALDWDGVSAWAEAPTNNNASLYRLVLQGASNARAVADSRIDLTTLQEWHDFNVTNSFEFNMVRDFTSSVYETLSDIASAGRASPAMVDGKWSVVIDKVQTVYQQHFSPRIVSGFEGTKSFDDLPHGLRLRFQNKLVGYRSDERLVYADGYSATNATEFVSIETLGITDPDQIYKSGRYYIASIILRPESWSFSCDYEYLVANRGALVKVSHDVLSVGLSYGRIKSMTLDGSSNVLSLVADENMPMEVGKTYGLIIRTVGDAALSAPIDLVTGENTSVVFTTPIPAADAPVVGDSFTFGETALETIDGIVQSISPTSELQATIKVVPYSAALFSSDTGVIPAFVSNITIPTGTQYPTIVDVRSDESVLQFLAEGGFVQIIAVTVGLTNRTVSVVTGISLRYRPEGDEISFIRLTFPLEATTLEIPGVETGTTYVIQVRFETDSGPGPWGPAATHLVVGASGLPDPIVDAIVKNGYIQWNYPSPPRDFAGYQLRRLPGTSSQNFAQAYDLHTGIITEQRFLIAGNIPSGTQTILIEAVDLVGNVSGDPAVVVLNLTPEVPIDLQESLDFKGSTFPGTITNGAISSASGNLEADSDGNLYLPAPASMYLTGSTELYLPVEYKEMTYVDTQTISTGSLPALVIANIVSAGLFSLAYRLSTSSDLYLSSGASTAFYLGTTAASTALYLPNSYGTTFMPYDAPFPVEQGTLAVQYKYVGQANNVQSIISAFDSIVDIDVLEEYILGTTISTAGTRLSLTNAYRTGTIRVANLTLLEDGGSAVTARVADQSTAGPLIKTLNVSNAGVTGTVNATVRGARNS
tara:strand:+ start:44363 stop:48370 length:4008 start_codon:yes stop_codon:yes gene_type:complete